MTGTYIYRKQHSEIIQIIDEMAPFLNYILISEDPVTIHGLFLKLSDKLFPHLMMEAKHLYPLLCIYQDDEVRIPAMKFYYKHKKMMQGLDEFKVKWDNPDSIQKRPFKFIKDCNVFCKALRQRIDKENNELFPLVER